MTAVSAHSQSTSRPLREWRAASLLAFAGALGSIALLPYASAMFPEKFAQIAIPLPVFALVQFLQSLLLLGVLAWAGLRLGRSVGLGAPLVQAIANRSQQVAVPARTLITAALAGVAVGVALIALEKAFAPMMPASAPTAPPEVAAWKGLLASFYGGVTEEILCRLFLMSLMVWMCCKLTSQQGDRDSAWQRWTGVLVAALLFGAGHLPAVADIWPLTTPVIVRTMLLNTIGGVVFGWLYWRRGLEHAMLAHFCADIVLHVVRVV